MEIIDMVNKHEPITGEDIAERLGVSRPTLRSDLAVLVMLGRLAAKPKVGYFLGPGYNGADDRTPKLRDTAVKDVQGLPVSIRESATVHDAVVTLFMENVGSLIVVNQEGDLTGIISRKDLLKVTLGNPGAASMPVSLVMTRQPNIITVRPEDSLLSAAEKMIKHQVDTLPVVRMDEDGSQTLVGRVTKTTMTRVLLEWGQG